MEYISPAADALRAIGMHPRYRGYSYILCILEETAKQPRGPFRVSTDLYPIVAERYGVSASAMERCMRFAIRKTWELGTPSFRQLFGAYDTAYAPTLCEFIAVMSECIYCRWLDRAV